MTEKFWDSTQKYCTKCRRAISYSVWLHHDGLCQWCKHKEGI